MKNPVYNLGRGMLISLLEAVGGPWSFFPLALAGAFMLALMVYAAIKDVGRLA